MTGRSLRLSLALLAAGLAGTSLTAQPSPVAAPPAPAATDSRAADDGLDLRFANGIAAIVEDRVITVDDIRRELAHILPQIRRESRNQKEFQEKVDAVQTDIVRQLVDRHLIVKEFRKDGKRRIPDSYIDNSISEQMTTRFDGDRSKFLAYLRARGLTLRDYRAEVEEDIIVGYMRGQQRKSQSIVSPARVESFYAENQKKFHEDERIHMRLIQLNRAEGESAEQLAGRAQSLLDRLDQGVSFEDLAKEHSRDSRSSRGGDWGWQTRTDLKAEFAEELFKLQKGQATAPIALGDSTFILYVEDRKAAGVPPIDEVRDQIELRLVQDMARESHEKWLERLRRNAYVKLY